MATQSNSGEDEVATIQARTDETETGVMEEAVSKAVEQILLRFLHSRLSWMAAMEQQESVALP